LEFRKALAYIIHGNHPEPEELEEIPEKERKLLRECEEIGIQRGFLKNLESCSGDAPESVVDDIAESLHEICELESNSVSLYVELVNLKSLITDCMEKSHEIADFNKIKVVTSFDSTPLRVYGDPERLKRVVSILLNNALKYSPAGGVIEVRAKGFPQEVVVSIVDHGRGVPIEKQRTIFQRFVDSKNDKTEEMKGTGIRLNLAKLIVAVHGGKVWVDNNEDGGCNFSFAIPREMLCSVAKEKKINSIFS